MKKLILFIFIMAFSLNAAQIIEESNPKYDKKIENLLKTRTGLTKKELDEIVDPFLLDNATSKAVEIVTKENNKSADLTLFAIIEKKAKINNKWCKVGDEINSFKITKISTTCVELKNQDKKLKLSLNKGNPNVVIK